MQPRRDPSYTAARKAMQETYFDRTSCVMDDVLATDLLDSVLASLSRAYAATLDPSDGPMARGATAEEAARPATHKEATAQIADEAP